jgi:hypothetical protein
MGQEQEPYPVSLPNWQHLVARVIQVSTRDTYHDPDADPALSSRLVAGGRVKETVRRETMLWTIFVILLVLWLLGVVTSYTLGGFIHVLLIVAVILAVMQLIQGRRAL